MFNRGYLLGGPEKIFGYISGVYGGLRQTLGH